MRIAVVSKYDTHTHAGPLTGEATRTNALLANNPFAMDAPVRPEMPKMRTRGLELLEAIIPEYYDFSDVQLLEWRTTTARRWAPFYCFIGLIAAILCGFEVLCHIAMGRRKFAYSIHESATHRWLGFGSSID